MGKMEARVSIVNLFDHTYLVRNGANQHGPRRALYGRIK